MIFLSRLQFTKLLILHCSRNQSTKMFDSTVNNQNHYDLKNFSEVSFALNKYVYHSLWQKFPSTVAPSREVASRKEMLHLGRRILSVLRKTPVFRRDW